MCACLKLKTCCGCIELDVGCLIIGYIQLIAEIIYILIIIASLAVSGPILSSEHEQVRKIGIFFLSVMIIMLIFLLVFLAFTITLLVGVYSKKRGHIAAYLVFAWIIFVLSVIGFFSMLAYPISAIKIIVHVVLLVVFLYFILVVGSYHQQLGDPNNTEMMSNTA